MIVKRTVCVGADAAVAVESRRGDIGQPEDSASLANKRLVGEQVGQAKVLIVHVAREYLSHGMHH